MTSLPSFFSKELLVFLAFFILALGLFLLVRQVIKNLLVSRGKASGFFLLKLLFPGIFLLVALFFEIRQVQETVPLGPKSVLAARALAVFFMSFFLIRLVDTVLLHWYQKRHLPFPLPKVLRGFILGILYLVVLFIVLKEIMKFNITPFLATSAILTMILGLAFQGVLSNILAGMSLNFTKSFSRGDWVKIGATEGVVMDTNWRETLIFDRASNVIVIPNNVVSSETITNFSRPDKKTALTIPVKASFTASPSSVLEALREASRDVPEVAASPAPQAFITGYDDWGVSYLLKFWVTDFSRKQAIIGEVGRLIWYKLKRRNIEIPVPLGERVKDVLAAVRREEDTARAGEIKTIYSDLLSSSFLRYQDGEKAGELIVMDGEVRELASLLKRERYAKGEVLFRQGEKGESCYIVAKGMIKGEIVYEEEGKRYLSEFSAGSGGIFGEMSLFTGMPRTATGIIAEDTELLEINAESFARILSQNPQVGETIAEIVSSRNSQNREFLRKIKELSEKDIDESCNKKSILARLKNLVRLLRGSE